MRKKFVGNLILLLFLNFLVKPIWILGIDRTIQNMVGLNEYGIYSALFNFSILFNILLDLGVTHYNSQAVAKNPVEVVRNFSYLGSLKILLGIVYVLATLVAGLLIGYDSFAVKMLLILCFNQFLSSLVLFLRSNLSGLQHYVADSILSVVDKTLMIIICGLLIYTSFGPEDFNVVHFALAQTASYLLTVAIAFIMVLKKVKVFRSRFDFKAFKEQLFKTLPYAMLILLMALYTRVDSVMLERIVGRESSGEYAAAFRLLDMVNQISYLFGMLLLPMFSNMIGKRENLSSLSKLSLSMVLTIIVAIAFSAFFNADYIMHSLYISGEGLAEIFKPLIISSIAFGSTYVFGTLLTAANQLKLLNRIAVSGFVLNIILNFILIPTYGAKGAAWTTLATQMLTTLLQAHYSFKEVDLKFPKAYGFRLIGFIGFAFGGAFALTLTSLSPLVQMPISFAMILILSMVFRLFNLKIAIATLKSRFK
jgi:O-antigen/teichoic acid export membrane protein